MQPIFSALSRRPLKLLNLLLLLAGVLFLAWSDYEFDRMLCDN